MLAQPPAPQAGRATGRQRAAARRRQPGPGRRPGARPAGAGGARRRRQGRQHGLAPGRHRAAARRRGGAGVHRARPARQRPRQGRGRRGAHRRLGRRHPRIPCNSPPAASRPEDRRLLTNIETAREMADPNSLYNRRAKVMVADVTGAPGDGDDSLTQQMRTRLALLGPDGADHARRRRFHRARPGQGGADRRQQAAHRDPVEHQERQGPGPRPGDPAQRDPRRHAGPLLGRRRRGGGHRGVRRRQRRDQAPDPAGHRAAGARPASSRTKRGGSWTGRDSRC